MKMLLPALAVLSSTAMAADFKWNLEGRFDYGMSTTKHEYATSTNNFEDKRAEFYSNVLRLNSVFTINESLSGRFRYRFSTAQGDKNGVRSDNRDLTFQNVDLFYIDHKNQWFTTRIGKHNQVESLGREYFMSGTDYPATMLNPTSTVANSTSTIGYTALNTTVYKLIQADADIYHVGVSAIYTGLQGQTFTLSAFNPQKTTTYSDNSGLGDDAKNTKMGLGAYYNGTFLDGLVQPTLGYTQFGIAPKTDVTQSPSATNKLMAAGIRSVVAGFTVDADWKQYKRQNIINSATTGTNTEDKTTSIWANAAYTWDMLTPFVNYIHDKFDATGTNFDDFKRDAISAGLMIKPFKDNNFRYHIAYTNDVKKVTLGATTATLAAQQESKIKSNIWTAGIKFDL
jgi:hypothetical protein